MRSSCFFFDLVGRCTLHIACVKGVLSELVKKDLSANNGSGDRLGLGCAARRPSRSRLPPTSVVIPLHGGVEDIRACLQSLSNCGDLVQEVIVVDNASTDGAAEVAAGFDFVTLIRNDANLGFGKGCNIGAAASSGEIVVFLNSDTVVPHIGLMNLLASLSRSEIAGAAGPYTGVAGFHQPMPTTYTEMATLDLFADDVAYSGDADREVEMLVGFCLAVKRPILDKIGTFDERFGIGLFEDNDLCYRIQRAGHKCILSTRSFVHHTGSQTFTRVGTDANALLAENHCKYFNKWKDDVSLGFASHLPGFDPEPIVFNESRRPERIEEELVAKRERARISVCMIVRNEERCLAECLRTVKRIAWQLIVVDTGSTDRTKDIAASFGAEVYDLPWTDSFSDARNESIRQATGDWIFWPDADDTLPLATAEQILNAAIGAPPEIVGSIVPVQFMDLGPNNGTRVDHLKLFRNLPDVRFEGRIHEQIVQSLSKHGVLGRIEFVVEHSGYDTSVEGQAKKRKRNTKLITLELRERPTNAFVNFNAGMTAVAHHRYRRARAYCLKSIELAASPKESHVRKAYALLAGLLQHEGDVAGSVELLTKALSEVGDDPELNFLLGQCHAGLGNLELAEHALLAVRPPPYDSFTSYDVGIVGFRRTAALAAVYGGQGKYALARGHYWAAIRENPRITELMEELQALAIQNGDLLTAGTCAQRVQDVEGSSERWTRMNAHATNLQTAFGRHIQDMCGNEPFERSGRPAYVSASVLRPDNRTTL